MRLNRYSSGSQRPPFRRLALVVLLDVTLAACGGGGGSSTQAPPPSPAAPASSPASSPTTPTSSIKNISVTPIGSGTPTCPLGGSQVISGNSVQYVCTGSDGKLPLIETQDLTAGDPACALGGARIRIGVDADGNGVLGASEISQTRHVCNAPAGAPVAAAEVVPLVSISSEPAGANCATGGDRLDYGKDLNGDGKLQSTEATSVSYVCRSSGGAGAGGTLITSQALSAGDAHCANGGSRIIAGSDKDGTGSLLEANGAIHAANVTSVSYVCNSAPGASTTAPLLSASVAFPSGNANCPQGGTETVTGRNYDGSSVLVDAYGNLKAANVLNAAYVCTGGAASAQVVVSSAAHQMAPNATYVAQNDASQVVLSLPANPKIGDTVHVKGGANGGWLIATNAGQSIQTSTDSSSTAGSLAGGIGSEAELVFVGDGKFEIHQCSGCTGVTNVGNDTDTGTEPAPQPGTGTITITDTGTGTTTGPGTPVGSVNVGSRSTSGFGTTTKPSTTLVAFADKTVEYGAPNFQLGSPFGTSTAVSYSSSNASVATVSPAGLVSITGVGTSRITATSGTGTKAVAELTVLKGKAKLTAPASFALWLGGPKFNDYGITLTDKVTSNNVRDAINDDAPPVRFRLSSDTTTGSVNIEGGVQLVTGLKQGSGFIIAEQVASKNYQAASPVKIPFTVSLRPTDIYIDNVEDKFPVNRQIDVKPLYSFDFSLGDLTDVADNRTPVIEFSNTKNQFTTAWHPELGNRWLAVQLNWNGETTDAIWTDMTVSVPGTQVMAPGKKTVRLQFSRVWTDQTGGNLELNSGSLKSTPGDDTHVKYDAATKTFTVTTCDERLDPGVDKATPLSLFFSELRLRDGNGFPGALSVTLHGRPMDPLPTGEHYSKVYRMDHDSDLIATVAATNDGISGRARETFRAKVIVKTFNSTDEHAPDFNGACLHTGPS